MTPDLDPELDDFLITARASLRQAQDRERAEALVLRWAGAWRGKHRTVTATHSNHGSYLHFNQLMEGGIWSHVFTFHAAHRHGLSLRGPDPDRTRKSHKLRRHRLDSSPLDALFDDWAAHPEARPAGHAVEFFLVETPDEVWEACLREVQKHLGS
ncbi:MAG TPA: hypothetical protein VJ600_07555 [Holophagaceae bacterium]|nr:hypothetical protein [Holophagaceae bacterium]